VHANERDIARRVSPRGLLLNRELRHYIGDTAPPNIQYALYEFREIALE